MSFGGGGGGGGGHEICFFIISLPLDLLKFIIIGQNTFDSFLNIIIFYQFYQ